MRASSRVGALVVTMMVTTLSPLAVNAQPAEQAVGEPFTIAAGHSHLCLTTAALDELIVQDVCTGSEEQLVSTVEVSPDPPALLLQAGADGLCVGPRRSEPGTPEVGSAPLTSVTCDPAQTDQQWQTTPSTVGGEVFRNVASGLCMDIFAESPFPSAVAVQYACNGGDNQRFVRVTDGQAASGSWGEVFDTGVIAVAMAILPTGKVLLWSSDTPLVANTGSGQTYTALLDPSGGGEPSVSQTLVTNTEHDMFCPGIAMLADGRVMVNGGAAVGSDGRRATSLFDPFTEEWTRDVSMNRSRWYNSSLVLADGDVVTMGGAGQRSTGMGPNDFPERWDSTVGWRPLPDADPGLLLDQTAGPQNRSGEHPRMFLREDGQIYVSGPSNSMGILDPEGLGSIEQTDERLDDGLSQTDSQVMFAPGLVLAAGGSASYDYGDDPATKDAQVIDVNTGEVVQTQPMAFARANGNSVALPTGEVLVIGGVPTGQVYSDIDAALHPEIWDPETGQWTTLAPMDVPRTYHSSAVLLPDGRVLAAGGGLCGETCDVNHPDGQIFSPPYLFRGDRPTITIAGQMSYGSTADVVVTGAVERFTMVRMSGATHATNLDQRVLPLNGVETAAGEWELSAPNDGNVAPPGYYMVFAVSADGVPSEAGIVRLLGNPTTTPNPYSPTVGSRDSGLPFTDFVRGGESWEELRISVDQDGISSVQIVTDVEPYARRGSVGQAHFAIPLAANPLVGLRGTAAEGRVTSLTALLQSGATSGPVGEERGESFELRVPEGQVARGLQGRSSEELDAIGLLTDADAAGQQNSTIVEPDPEPEPGPTTPEPTPTIIPTPTPTPSPPPGNIIDPGPAPGPDEPAGPVDPGPPVIDIGPATARISAISHAVAISRARFGAAEDPEATDPRTQVAAHAVIARSDIFADALTGTVLTGDGPMLLSDGSIIAEDVEEELRRTLGTGGTVYLLGGEKALASSVADELVGLGYDTVRLMGPTRIETALAIADEAERMYGPRDVIALARADGPFANGSAWADSITSGVWAAREGAPILLTPTESLHPGVSAWLGGHRNTQRIAVGGTAAVSEAAATAAGVDRRVAGTNRFSTAVAIGDELLWPDPGGFVIANGADPDAWAFALPAAGYAADISWPMLLVAPGIIPAETGDATCRTGSRTAALFLGDYSMISAIQRDFLVSPCS